jgi:dynactin-5
VRVEDGAVLPPGSMWASGSVVAGRPGRVVGEVGEAWGGVEGGMGVGGVALVGGRERWAGVGNKR